MCAANGNDSTSGTSGTSHFVTIETPLYEKIIHFVTNNFRTATDSFDYHLNKKNYKKKPMEVSVLNFCIKFSPKKVQLSTSFLVFSRLFSSHRIHCLVTLHWFTRHILLVNSSLISQIGFYGFFQQRFFKCIFYIKSVALNINVYVY